MTRQHRPVTEEERGRIRELHAQGMSANAMGRELGRAASTITYHCGQMGLSFDRTQVQAANQARRADAATRRAALSERLLGVIETSLDEMEGPYTRIDYVGRDGRRVQDVLEQVPAKEKLDLMRLASLATDKHMKLVEFDREKDQQNLSLADRFLAAMMGGAPDDGDDG